MKQFLLWCSQQNVRLYRKAQVEQYRQRSREADAVLANVPSSPVTESDGPSRAELSEHNETGDTADTFVALDKESPPAMAGQHGESIFEID